jgi:hypothetical protein
VRLVKPVVPALAGSITVRNLTLGGASVDFVLASSKGRSRLEVMRASGPVRVLLDT